MKIVYDKLVRDKIPEAIQKSNKSYKARVLNTDEYKYELKRKLVEESKEVFSSEDKISLMKELADVLEVIDAIVDIYNIDDGELSNIKTNKANINGKFEKMLFLEYVSEEDEK